MNMQLIKMSYDGPTLSNHASPHLNLHVTIDITELVNISTPPPPPPKKGQ